MVYIEIRFIARGEFMDYRITYLDSREGVEQTPVITTVGAESPAQARLVLLQLTGIPQSNLVVCDIEYVLRPSDGKLPSSFWSQYVSAEGPSNPAPAPAPAPVSMRAKLTDGSFIDILLNQLEMDQRTVLEYVEVIVDRDVALGDTPKSYITIDRTEYEHGRITVDPVNTRRVLVRPVGSNGIAALVGTFSLRVPEGALINWDRVKNEEVTITLTVNKVPLQLATPSSLSIVDDVLTWVGDENADEYEVYNNDTLLNPVEEATLTLALGDLIPGTYHFTVKAIGDGEDYIDSAVSAAVTVIVELVPEQLSAPDNLSILGSVLTFDPVDNASIYAVYEDDNGSLEFLAYAPVRELLLDLSTYFTNPGTYSIVVKSIGDGIAYLDSLASTAVNYVIEEEPATYFLSLDDTDFTSAPLLGFYYKNYDSLLVFEKAACEVTMTAGGSTYTGNGRIAEGASVFMTVDDKMVAVFLGSVVDPDAVSQETVIVPSEGKSVVLVVDAESTGIVGYHFDISEIDLVPLSTPEFAIEGDVITITEVEGAAGYEVSFTDSVTALNTSNLVLDLYEGAPIAATYLIQVKATASGEDKYDDSEYSSEYECTRVPRALDAPESVQKQPSNVITWGYMPIPSPDSWDVYLDSVFTATVAAPNYNVSALTGTHVIAVVSVDSTGKYLDSEPSTSFEFTI